MDLDGISQTLRGQGATTTAMPDATPDEAEGLPLELVRSARIPRKMGDLGRASGGTAGMARSLLKG